MLDYPKIQLGHPAFERISRLQALGFWACDSIDHNEGTGCSNPDCFKHSGFVSKEPTAEAIAFLSELFKYGKSVTHPTPSPSNPELENTD